MQNEYKTDMESMFELKVRLLLQNMP